MGQVSGMEHGRSRETVQTVRQTDRQTDSDRQTLCLPDDD